MDEDRDMDVSVAKSNLEESAVNFSEHIAGESETQLELMAEVVSSHVSVDGECTNDDGGKGGGEGEGEGNSNDEEICGRGGSGEVGLEGDLRGVDGMNDVVGDPGSRETDISGGEASLDSGFGTAGGGPLVEERVARESVEREKGGGDVFDEMTQGDDDVLNDGVNNGGRETDVSGGEASLDSGFGTAGGGPLVEERVARESVEREKGGGDVLDEMPQGDDDVLNDGVNNGGRETDVTGGEASLDSGFGTAGGGPLVEERVARESVEREKGGGDVLDEMPQGDDDVLNDGVNNGGRETDVTGGEASLDSEFGTVGGGPLVEERVARESVEREKGGGDVFDEMPQGDDDVLNDRVNNGGTETRIEGSAAVLCSTDGETEVRMKDTAVITSEEGLEGILVKEDEERDSEKVGSMGGEAQDHGAENGVRSSTVTRDTLDGKTQTLALKEVTENENASGKELVKGAEQGREIDAGEEDTHQDVDMQEVIMESENASGKELVKSAKPNRETDAGGEDAHQDIVVSDDKIRNPGIETAVTGSSGLVQDSSFQAPAVEEAAVVVRGEVLNAKDDDLGNNDGQTGKSNVIKPNPESLDEQTPVSVSGEVTVTDKEEFLCSTVEGMETDTFDENLSFSLEELQGNIERVDGSTENHSNVCADATSSCQPTLVVGDEVAAMDKKVHPNSESNQQLKSDGFLDQGAAHDVARVESNKEKTMEIDEQVANSEFEAKLFGSENIQDFKAETLCMGTKIDTHDDKKGNELVDNQDALNSNVEVEGHAEKDQNLKHEESLEVEHQVNDVGGRTDNHRSDLLSTSQPTDEVIECEVMAVDDKVPSDPTVESCSGNDQRLRDEIFGGNAETDSQVMNGDEITLLASEEKVEGLGPADGDKMVPVNSSLGQNMQIEEQVIDVEQDGSDGGQGMEAEEQDSDTEQPESTEKFVKPTIMKLRSSVMSHQASYQLPLEDEGEFKVSDLVWGKVRSHPWWPGQIYDPSDASEKAMKYHKKDCFLVAYFGDRTFAWVDAPSLKPFYSHFSLVENQSYSEVFQNAVNCALEEVSRRIELGLACSCIPNGIYDDIKFQMVENTGIWQESSMRDGMIDSAGANSFQPDKLFEYMKALAQCPSGGADRLELVIAKAQLLSFYRLKGYCQLPEYQNCGGLVENGADNVNPISKDDDHISSGKENLENQRSSYNKRKHNLKDCIYSSKKERSLSELMSGSFDSLDDDEFGFDEKSTSKLVSPSGKRQKAVDSIGDDSLQDGRKTISLAKVSITTPQVPKPSFKIGECIRRAASQMTGSPSILKSNNSERFQKFEVDGSDVSFENFEDAEGKRMVLPTDYSSLDGLLSQLHLVARDPMKGYSFLNMITSFFSDFRNSIILDRNYVNKAGGKRKKPSHLVGTPETFEFEDMNDTYWTDRVIQNGGEEEQPLGRNGGGEYKTVPVELGKPVQKSRRSYSRKQYSDGNHDATPAKPPGYVDENAPAELVMNFSEMDSIPSETKLSKTFRRFGPIKESETEVDKESSRARVVFKRCADAEVAYSSAAKFNIFGSVVVNYQLSYTISVPFSASSIALTLGEDMQLDVDTLGV